MTTQRCLRCRFQRRFLPSLAFVVLAVVTITIGSTAAQQLPPIPVKRTTGQSIVPVFEGWERNSDDTFSMVFGYMNRNYTEGISVAVGPANRFESGEADRGQPTFFYPRRQQFLFRARVPKDWGDKELIWTLTVNGQTERAYGSLKPVWELSRSVIVDNVHGNDNINFADKDQPPSLKVDPVPSSVSLASAAVTLSGVATDPDGIPPPPKPRPTGLAVGRSDSDVAPPFINVPFAPPLRFPAGLSAGWIVYRGPAGVTFDPAGYRPVPATGRFVTKATFSRAGTYVLRAIASDSMLETIAEFTVTVTGDTR
jgi:hypothetical protein